MSDLSDHCGSHALVKEVRQVRDRRGPLRRGAKASPDATPFFMRLRRENFGVAISFAPLLISAFFRSFCGFGIEKALARPDDIGCERRRRPRETRDPRSSRHESEERSAAPHRPHPFGPRRELGRGPRAPRRAGDRPRGRRTLVRRDCSQRACYEHHSARPRGRAPHLCGTELPEIGGGGTRPGRK